MTSLVVKLGGSTADAAELDTWLKALADSRLPLVIVPGGGPFADFVRESQPRLGISDNAAHAMAILAMEQFAHLLLDRRHDMLPARSLVDLRAAADRLRPVVWLPTALALSTNDIAASWDVTSDSIAAWLAAQLACPRLLLIKQTSVIRPGDTVEGLAASGVVDAALPSMLPAATELYIAGPSHASTAANELAADRIPGMAIGRSIACRKAG